MKDFQEFKKIKIKKIHTVEQLVSSLIIADIIVEIRDEHKLNQKETIKMLTPDLEGNISERARKLYYKAADLMSYKPYYLYLLKYAIEDIFKYNFRKDPSVVTTSPADSAYLNSVFGSGFVGLAKINLEDHTLNVFEFAIDDALKSGRPSSMVAPILGAILHDFGKSTEIRKKIKGVAQSRSFTAHPDVSASYVRELLLTKLYNTLDDIPVEIIDGIANMVKNHHPQSDKLKGDLNIAFIIKADHSARKMEYQKIKQENRKEEN